MKLEKVKTPATLPHGIRGGVHHNLLAPNTVTFILRAPYKPFVSLVGDFNDWNTLTHIMQTDGDSTWWITLPHPGETRYGYYVAIDDQAHAWVGDPCATQVRWGRRAPWAWLPEPMSAFEWHDLDWQTPALRDLIIYELCVRDFAGRWENNRPIYGNFQELTEYVDYFAKMGINAIELMPIQEFPGQSSWGYNPVFYFAVENTYGTPDDFKQFVDTCHRHGIAVILDVAFNHAWGDHPYYQIYPPLYSAKGEWLEDWWNPFLHHTPQAINMWGGVDWDHFHPETTHYFQDVVRFWLQEYHVDGFRFDWVGGVDYDSNQPMRPGFDPFHGISAICWAARQIKPDCILIGEYWQLEGTHHEKTSARLIAETEMDACWNGLFHHTVEDMLNQKWEWEKLDIFRAIGGFREEGFTTATQLVNYTCSHDEVRPEHEVKFYSHPHIQYPAHMTLHELALAKARLGLILLFTMPGIPMIYAGQEFGEDTPRTIDFLPLNWHKLQKSTHASHFAMVRQLIHARQSYAALRSDQIEFYPEDFPETKILRFNRWHDCSDMAVVGVNFGEEACEITLELPRDGTWRELLSEQVYEISDGLYKQVLTPWDGIILVPDRL